VSATESLGTLALTGSASSRAPITHRFQASPIHRIPGQKSGAGSPTLHFGQLPSAVSIEQAHKHARDDAFQGRSEHSTSDLLRPKARAALRHAVESWQPGRGARAQEKWSTIVRIASAKPRTLGFVILNPRGTEALAKILGTSSGNVSGTLSRWKAATGAVLPYTQERERGLPVVTGLQIPDLTDALVWLATRTFYKLQGSSLGGPPMTIPQAQLIAATLLRRRQPIPEITTFDQAARLLDELNPAARLCRERSNELRRQPPLRSTALP
jgi:hypothetical protein